ncbi:hypothetical protein HK405_004833 [Cladochytrium tenue]|nr:hypothetical protein HK405_004833 [Cladochytrium tenue]
MPTSLSPPSPPSPLSTPTPPPPPPPPLLAADVLVHVLACLPALRDVLRVRRVCRAFRDAAPHAALLLLLRGGGGADDGGGDGPRPHVFVEARGVGSATASAGDGDGGKEAVRCRVDLRPAAFAQADGGCVTFACAGDDGSRIGPVEVASPAGSSGAAAVQLSVQFSGWTASRDGSGGADGAVGAAQAAAEELPSLADYVFGPLIAGRMRSRREGTAAAVERAQRVAREFFHQAYRATQSQVHAVAVPVPASPEACKTAVSVTFAVGDRGVIVEGLLTVMPAPRAGEEGRGKWVAHVEVRAVQATLEWLVSGWRSGPTVPGADSGTGRFVQQVRSARLARLQGAVAAAAAAAETDERQETVDGEGTVTTAAAAVPTTDRETAVYHGDARVVAFLTGLWQQADEAGEAARVASQLLSERVDAYNTAEARPLPEAASEPISQIDATTWFAAAQGAAQLQVTRRRRWLEASLLARGCDRDCYWGYGFCRRWISTGLFNGSRGAAADAAVLARVVGAEAEGGLVAAGVGGNGGDGGRGRGHGGDGEAGGRVVGWVRRALGYAGATLASALEPPSAT